MSVIYRCDRCGLELEAEQAEGYSLLVGEIKLVIRPVSHLCVQCLLRILEQAALSSERADLLVGVKVLRGEPS